MHSLDSNFSSSDAWSHMLTQPCPLFLPPFWQHFRCLDSEVSVLLTQGLSAQRRFIDFCRQDGCANQDGSIPQRMRRLMRFASLLADNLNHSSIKVYLSAVCSLHIDHSLHCLNSSNNYIILCIKFFTIDGPK